MEKTIINEQINNQPHGLFRNLNFLKTGNIIYLIIRCRITNR